MTEEWASLWYQCLTCNMDYNRYCTAREEGNQAKCAEYESRFDRISGLYDDFGTLDGWPESGMQSQLWREWFEPRKHLFLGVARSVEDVSQYAPRAGYMLLEVPLQENVKATVAVIADAIAEHYETGEVVAATPPKYVLRMKNGKPAHGLQQVRQACRSVVRSYRYDLETADILRNADAVAAFVRYEIDNMGWSLDPRAREELHATGRLSEQRLESFKAMLNKCRRDFRAFAANAIRASFPDDRPYDSDVQQTF